jgi:hypothetical protein
MEASNPLVWLIGLAVAFIGGLFAHQKHRADKAEVERDKAVERAVEAETEADVEEIKREHEESSDLDGVAWFKRWRRRSNRPTG